MNKLLVSGLVCLSVIATSCQKKQDAIPAEKPVRIRVELRPEINYVTHLYTLAGLGFEDKEYCEKYGNTLPASAIDTLRTYKDLLTFGQGEGGSLSVFFFAVGADSLANSTDMQRLMDRLDEQGREMEMSDDIMAAKHAIQQVFVDYYDAYLAEIYPHAVEDMTERMNILNNRLQQVNFVKDWENITGYHWTHGDYHWLLYRAGDEGPSYNNLNPNTNTVYYDQALAYQMAMFSHEFGIFLLMDSISPVLNNYREKIRQLPDGESKTFLPWSAFESLSCWYNCQIAGEKTLDYLNFGEADVVEFCQLYDSLSQSGVMRPVELYRRALASKMKE